MTRKILKVGSLPDDVVQALRESKMDERHFVGQYCADYSLLTVEEIQTEDPDLAALLANSKPA